MGQISPQVRRRAPLAAAVLGLVLTACSGPAPSGPPPGQATSSRPQASTSAPGTPETSAATAGATPGATAGATPGSPVGGLGGFGTVTEACGAVSATVVSALVLPVAAAGKDTANVGKAKEALAKIQGRAPAELKDSFDKLKSIADDAGQDFSGFNSEEFDQAIVPIDAWLQANC